MSPPPIPVIPAAAAQSSTDPLKTNLTLIVGKVTDILLTTPESDLKALPPENISELISTIQTLSTSLSPTPPKPTLPKGIR